MRNTVFMLAALLLASSCGNSDSDVADVRFVHTSEGAVLTGSTLTLTGVDEKTGWFTDRPVREAGQVDTAGFVRAWGEGPDSFAAFPPKADFTCAVDGEVIHRVVELRQASRDGDELVYEVSAVGNGSADSEIACTGAAHLFVDSKAQKRDESGGFTFIRSMAS